MKLIIPSLCRAARRTLRCRALTSTFPQRSTFNTNDGASGYITINSGTIHAAGSRFGAGSGGWSNGEPSSGGNITIKGGFIQATAGHMGAGIGGGYTGTGGNIVIDSGIIWATGGGCNGNVGGLVQGGGAGIGGGAKRGFRKADWGILSTS